MNDFLTIIAAVEWIVLGLFTFRKLRYWNRRYQALYDDLVKEMDAHG